MLLAVADQSESWQPAQFHWTPAARARLGIGSRAVAYTDPAQAICTDFSAFFNDFHVIGAPGEIRTPG
jgi:hypothetical protein